jgi:protein involved in polysaccharide export with SLBB domain
MIPLASWRDVEKLEGRAEVSEVIDAARRYPNSLVYLAGYVTDADTRQHHADATNLGDELVIQTARHLAARGIDANRISGRGMGVNKTIGRAIVVSLDVTPRAVVSDLNPRQLAERTAAEQVPERQPAENRTFKQVAGLPAYKVGPGDVLKVSYRMAGNAEFAAPVSPLGTISFDLIEEAPVAGLTTTEIESLLKSMLKRYFRQPRIAVGVVTYASKSVTLITPTGTRLVALAGRTTVFDLIVNLNLPTGAAAPGVADLKAIRVTRGTQDYEVNVFEIVQNHDWKQNLVLDEGDMVYMPTFTEIGDYVTILGAVGKPGIYPMSVGLTVSQALFMAGGATKTAYLPHSRIIRGDPQHPTIIPTDVDLVIEQGLVSAEKKLRAGDIIYVPSTRIANWNDFIADLRPTLQLVTEPFRFYYFFRVFNQ